MEGEYEAEDEDLKKLFWGLHHSLFFQLPKNPFFLVICRAPGKTLDDHCLTTLGFFLETKMAWRSHPSSNPTPFNFFFSLQREPYSILFNVNSLTRHDHLLYTLLFICFFAFVEVKIWDWPTNPGWQTHVNLYKYTRERDIESRENRTLRKVGFLVSLNHKAKSLFIVIKTKEIWFLFDFLEKRKRKRRKEMTYDSINRIIPLRENGFSFNGRE